MKKAINISIGRTSFTIEEDAFEKLKNYLDRFEASISEKDDVREVMEDVEARIAEIFREHVRSNNQVVGIDLVDKVIAMLGTPESSNTTEKETKKETANAFSTQPRARKRFYRDPDHSMVGGVCAGLSAYFNIDLLLVRILFGCAVAFGGLSIWVYLIMWIAAPMAKTISEKLEMRGEPVTAENIRRYSAK